MISALLFNSSVPGQAFMRSLKRGAILVSQPLMEELNEVLGRDKLPTDILGCGQQLWWAVTTLRG